MKIIGIAGPSGSGKSTVAAHLAARGGVHVDADRIGHEVLAEPTVMEAVRARIGADVFDAYGAVDRRALAEKVFGDPRLLCELNAITHPAIGKRCARLIDAARTDGAPFVVLDAALLLDAPMPVRFDLVIALRADGPVRFERIMAKGGWDEDAVRARLAGQSGIEKSFYKADVVVDTDGVIADVLNKVDALVDALLRGANGEHE